MENNTLKQSINVTQIVGVLSEKALTKEAVTKEIEGKKVTMEVIKGELSVETTNGIFKGRVYCQSKTKNGENKMFKGWETIYREYKDKLKNGDEADKVIMKIAIDENAYSTDGKTLNLGEQVNISKINRTTDIEVEHPTDGKISGVIKSIVPEVVNENETARLKVELINIAYGGKAQIINLVVGEDLAEDFKDIYTKGVTCVLDVEAKMVQKGSVDKATRAFGRKSEVKSGYEVLEIAVVGGQEPMEEELSYNVNEIATALQEREASHQAIIEKKAKEMAQGKGGAVPTKPKTVGRTTSVTPVDEDGTDDLPF